MSHLDFENAKAYLQRDNGGRNLYEHLSEVLQKILKDKPENATEMFEYISSAVKQSKYIPKAIPGEPEVLHETFTYVKPAYNTDSFGIILSNHSPLTSLTQLQNPEYTKFASATASLLSLGESGAAPVQDVMAECDALEWAGVNIGREDSYRLYLNMNKLAASSGATGLRFWGKILGRGGDYFIVEVKNCSMKG
jgi:radial spoke head protein 4A